VLGKISGTVDLSKAALIADLGCGPAGLFLALENKKVTAVDPLLDKYEEITSFFRRSDYPNTTFITSTIEDFISSKKFETVFCMNAINHVQDIQKGFQKLRELCADNGIIVVTVDAHNYGFFKHSFRLIPGDILHPYQFDLEEYRKLLEQDGWKVCDTQLLKHEFFFNHYLLVTRR